MPPCETIHGAGGSEVVLSNVQPRPLTLEERVCELEKENARLRQAFDTLGFWEAVEERQSELDKAAATKTKKEAKAAAKAKADANK